MKLELAAIQRSMSNISENRLQLLCTGVFSYNYAFTPSQMKLHAHQDCHWYHGGDVSIPSWKIIKTKMQSVRRAISPILWDQLPLVALCIKLFRNQKHFVPLSINQRVIFLQSQVFGLEL